MFLLFILNEFVLLYFSDYASETAICESVREASTLYIISFQRTLFTSRYERFLSIRAPYSEKNNKILAESLGLDTIFRDTKGACCFSKASPLIFYSIWNVSSVVFKGGGSAAALHGWFSWCISAMTDVEFLRFSREADVRDASALSWRSFHKHFLFFRALSVKQSCNAFCDKREYITADIIYHAIMFGANDVDLCPKLTSETTYLTILLKHLILMLIYLWNLLTLDENHTWRIGIRSFITWKNK